ncbi:5'-nucleotidase [Paenibacillus thiaminolyticus]|uniref:5'-nucleotidase n=1 Tax=Paenibacillus thiaminolyticus TaxID=49283 RepID=A0AAP9IZW8_PANTH|nr:5'-nucleotidase [Paenibacillus thiaminolyticus]MCY9535957.1 5'-nucleotidase [Paenibacillus thiaminolyticus]MCY9602382.1 5'-nucleotidase [Paenibacillus thiaminolyticus]MCY9608777.1 5'-nucleotidase [Paenibacillus thiaminolyticus]MCY9613524.1 5'-nucleotidase [Paenibacillus thiaminolyticus]MCY9620342.1 5'-nucleotidase [Paenibacillus thiaminolyticus]
MPYDIEQKLVIATASSALFDLAEADQVFQEKGEEAYRQYQRAHEYDILRTGVAFPLIKRLLQLNGSSADDQPVEVVLLSRNDPDTGLRVFKSIEHYGLNISRAVFVAGSNPFPYMEAFNASLFLSGNPKDVTEAVERGCPAGCIYPTDYIDDDEDEELRIAFDFDGIIADDSAETVFQEGGELKLFHDHERTLADEPLPPGPLLRFFTDIANLQKREIERNERDASYKPKIRVAIATARNAPAHERVITTLRKLDIRVDEAFFLGGIEKGRVLRIFKPHIFFDDQMGHIEGVARIVPSVHVPFGVTNGRSG